MKEKFVKALKAIKSALSKPIKGLKNMKKPVKIALCIVLAAAVALAGFGIYKWRKTKKTASDGNAGTSIVQIGNLTNSITGSGSVEPIEQRDIVPEVNGKIVESYFEEGDEVRTGDVLYRFEMTAATNAIESAQNNVEKAQTNLSNRQSSLSKVRENIEKLTVKATESGKISDLSLRVGEEISGKLCTITNFKEQTATIPFSSAHINSIKVGDKANIAVDKYMINTTGTVVRKYTAPETLSSGAVVYYVEIRLSNDYTLEENVNVTATVGSVSSASYGAVKYADPVTVNAEQRGKVSKVNFKNGDWVDKGEVIAILKNTDLNDELRTAQQNVKEAQMNLTEALNNLEDKEEEANEYIVTSPIDGVILTKDYTTGDTISGQNSTTMMVVADMSKMKFTISADELDISKIQMGQSVQVTADALEGQRLTGRITAISKLGTSSNGVTNYPIEVTIDQPGDLMPGMNVSAQIIVEQSYNTLYLPVEAVEYFGGKYYVTVVGEVENMPEMPKMPEGGFGSKAQDETKDSTQNGAEESSKQDKENQSENSGEEAKLPQKYGEFGGQRPGGGYGEMPQRPQNMQSGEMPQRYQNGQNGEMPQRPQSMQSGEAAQYPKKDEEAPSAEKNKSAQSENTKPTDTEKNNGSKKSENTEKDNDKTTENRQNFAGGQTQQREELKIKLSGKEQRVEVEIGIATDQYYEIKSGVEYGQVVKNTTQVSSSSNSGMMGGMRGGMPAGMMGGGMPSGMSGGMGANRTMGSNRSGGNNRSMGGR